MRKQVYYNVLGEKIHSRSVLPSTGQWNTCWAQVLSACVSGACYQFKNYIGPEVVAFILLVALSLIAMFFDILPVLLAAALSALIWDYFFLLPRFNFRVGNTEDKIMLSMYFLIALVSAVLTYKIREVEKMARHKEGTTRNRKALQYTA